MVTRLGERKLLILVLRLGTLGGLLCEVDRVVTPLGLLCEVLVLVAGALLTCRWILSGTFFLSLQARIFPGLMLLLIKIVSLQWRKSLH
jgi:hypothetical protein